MLISQFSHFIARLLVAFVAIASIHVPVADAQPVARGDEFALGSDPMPNYQTLQRTRAVSRSADGSFVVVWHKQNSTDYAGIFVQRYRSDGVPEGTEFRVSGEMSPYGSLFSNSPAVAHTKADEFVVVWQGPPTGGASGYAQVMGQRLDAAANLVGTEFQVNIATPRSYGAPDVSDTGAGGNFVVVWEGRPDLATYQYQIMGRRFDSAGATDGTEFMVNTFSTGYTNDPQVDSSGDGTFVVAWTAAGRYGYGDAPDGSYGGIFAQRFGAGGGRAGTEFQVNTFWTYSQQNSDIAVAPNGNFVVVWTSVYGDEHYGLKNEEQMEFGTLLDHSITVQRFDPEGGFLGEEEHINVYQPGNQISPSVAIDDDGRFVIVWESSSAYYPGSHDNRDDMQGGLWGRSFSANGVGSSQEFHVNSYTTGLDQNLSIATDGSGEFVVVWSRAQSFYGATNGYGRRFRLGDGPATTTTTITTTTTTTTTPTPTTTTTTTTIPPGDGICADPVAIVAQGRAGAPGLVTASDALFALHAAVSLITCPLCQCDVDGNEAVTATDALTILRIAIGQALPLNCPACT